MNEDSHRGYNLQREEEDKNRWKIMQEMDAKRTSRQIIDTWSKQARDNVKNHDDLMKWVNGLIKLYRAEVK